MPILAPSSEVARPIVDPQQIKAQLDFALRHYNHPLVKELSTVLDEMSPLAHEEADFLNGVPDGITDATQHFAADMKPSLSYEARGCNEMTVEAARAARQSLKDDTTHETIEVPLSTETFDASFGTVAANLANRIAECAGAVALAVKPVTPSSKRARAVARLTGKAPEVSLPSNTANLHRVARELVESLKTWSDPIRFGSEIAKLNERALKQGVKEVLVPHYDQLVQAAIARTKVHQATHLGSTAIGLQPPSTGSVITPPAASPETPPDEDRQIPAAKSGVTTESASEPDPEVPRVIGNIKTPFSWQNPDTSIELSTVRIGETSMVFTDAMPPVVKSLSVKLRKNNSSLRDKFNATWSKIQKFTASDKKTHYGAVRLIHSGFEHPLFLWYDNSPNKPVTIFTKIQVSAYPKIAKIVDEHGIDTDILLIKLAETDYNNRLTPLKALSAQPWI